MIEQLTIAALSGAMITTGALVGLGIYGAFSVWFESKKPKVKSHHEITSDKLCQFWSESIVQKERELDALNRIAEDLEINNIQK